jgi:hypothetical protein
LKSRTSNKTANHLQSVTLAHINTTKHQKRKGKSIHILMFFLHTL